MAKVKIFIAKGRSKLGRRVCEMVMRLCRIAWREEGHLSVTAEQACCNT